MIIYQQEFFMSKGFPLWSLHIVTQGYFFEFNGGLTMRIDFSDQVAVVTGAGGGIGRAVALALSDIGAKLRRYSNQGGRRFLASILNNGWSTYQTKRLRVTKAN